jgi:hypothetical protein
VVFFLLVAYIATFSFESQQLVVDPSNTLTRITACTRYVVLWPSGGGHSDNNAVVTPVTVLDPSQNNAWGFPGPKRPPPPPTPPPPPCPPSPPRPTGCAPGDKTDGYVLSIIFVCAKKNNERAENGTNAPMCPQSD